MPRKAASSHIATGTATIPRDTELETWKNATAGLIVIHRTGEYGRRLEELISGGRVFQVAPQERRNMQNIAATPELDMFTNGMLQPVSLVDGEPDGEFLRSNPNVLEDRDIPKLLALPYPQFLERLNAISHLPTITRLLGVAREPEMNMTVTQYEVIKRREKAIRAATEGLIEPPDADDTGEDLPRPVTPR
jgi:hypothetical protein